MMGREHKKITPAKFKELATKNLDEKAKADAINYLSNVFLANERYLSDSLTAELLKQLEAHLRRCGHKVKPDIVFAGGPLKPIKTKPSSEIVAAPGSLVLKMAEFLCTNKVYERVFLQAVLDMRDEYNEALFKGRKEKAQWVLIRSYLALAWSVTLQVIEFLLSGPVKIIKSLWG